MRGLPLYGPSLFALADPGEGPGPPLFQDQTEARRAEKNFFETPPRLYEGPLLKPKGLYCIFIYPYVILYIVVIFSLSSTSFLNVNSNFCSRYSVFYQCSSVSQNIGPK